VKLQRHGAIACLALATLAMAACGSNNNTSSGSSQTPAAQPTVKCASGSLTSQGSTAQANAMSAWIKAYQTKCNGAQITYTGTGSGAGVSAFTAGTADFAGSDSALKDGDEQTKADARCKGGTALDLPMVTGPIAVVFNVSGVDSLQFKPETLAGIFSGKIKTWNDAAIKADNPGVTLPSTAIQAVHRSDSSGTTQNFTKYLEKSAASAWTYADDKVWKAPGGVAAKGSDGVAALVGKTDGTIAYAEWSYATNASLKTAKIYNGAGSYQELTADAAGKTIAGAQVVGQGDNLKLSIDYKTTEAGAYPIVLVTYEIVCSKGNASDNLDLLKSFLTYTASDQGQQQLTAQGYAPLPKTVQTKVQSAIDTLS
jgi:phosphate transport system substrate-binding protein